MAPPAGHLTQKPAAYRKISSILSGGQPTPGLDHGVGLASWWGQRPRKDEEPAARRARLVLVYFQEADDLENDHWESDQERPLQQDELLANPLMLS